MVHQSVEPLHGSSSSTRSCDGGGGGGGGGGGSRSSSSVDERDEAKLWQQCGDDAEEGKGDGQVVGVERPDLTRGQLLRIACGMLGLMFGWAMKTVLTTPLFRDVYGVDTADLGFVWLAGPLSGLVVQPVIGVISDHREGQGQRSFFFAGGAAVMAASLALLPAAGAVWRRVGAPTSVREGTGTGLAVVALWSLDLAMNASLVAIRAVVADCAPPRQQPEANTVILVSYGTGTLLGYGFSALDAASWFGLPPGAFWTSCVDFWVAAVVLLLAAAVASREAYRLERPRPPFPPPGVRGNSAGQRGRDSRDSPGARGGIRGVEATYAPVEIREDGSPRWGRGGQDDDLEGRRWRRRRWSQRHEGEGWRAGSEEEEAALSPGINGGKGAAAAAAPADLGERREGEGRGREEEEEEDEDEEGGPGGSAPGNTVDGGFLTLSGGMGDGRNGSRHQEAVVRGEEGADEAGSGGAGARSEQSARGSVTVATSAADAVEGNGPSSSLKVRLLDMVLFYDVPAWLLPVCALLFFSWIGWFAIIIFGSDWVGVNVFGGDASATSGEQRQAYVDGVKWASLGLAVQAVVVTVMGCGPVTRLVRAVGLKGAFLTAAASQSVCLLCAVFLRPGAAGRTLSLVILAALGVPLALIESLPYMIVGMYSPRDKNGQLLGKLNVWIVLAQLALTLCVNPIVNNSNNGDASVLFAGAVGASIGLFFVPAIGKAMKANSSSKAYDAGDDPPASPRRGLLGQE